MNIEALIKNIADKREIHQAGIEAVRQYATSKMIAALGSQSDAARYLSAFHGFTISQSMISKALKRSQSIEKIYPLARDLVIDLNRDNVPSEALAAFVRELRFSPVLYSLVYVGGQYGVFVGATLIAGQPYAIIEHTDGKLTNEKPLNVEFL